MANVGYKSEIKIEAHRMRVYEGLSYNLISKSPGMPSPATLIKWGKKKNKDGMNWDDEMEQFQSEKFALMAPGGLAIKILKAIEHLMSKDVRKLTPKDADALSKFHKSFVRIVDKRYHVHMMFEVMKDLVLFLKQEYPDLIKDGKLFNSFRLFKNNLLTRMGERL